MDSQETALKTQIENTKSALENLADETSKTEGNLCDRVIAVEEVLNAVKAYVKRPEREFATEAERRQQL